MNPDWEDLAERYDWGRFVLAAAELVGRAHGLLLGAGVLYTGSGMAPLLQVGPELLEREPPLLEEKPPAPLLPVSEMDPGILEKLLPIEAPPETLVMFVGPSLPLGASGARVPAKPQVISADRGEVGTLGPRLELAGYGAVFSTAGHVLGDPGSQVDIVSRTALGLRRQRRLGEVVFRSEPDRSIDGGYDIGLIQSELRLSAESCEIAHLGVERDAPFAASLLGGRSGIGHGFIQGALKKHADESGRAWKNSWMLLPGEIGAEGDSGAAVLATDGRLIGIQVGGSQVLGSRRLAVLYVHDLEALLEDQGW